MLLPRQQLILICASISVFFEALDIAIINLTLPMIQQTFGLSTGQLQWVQTLYVLLYGGLLILGGQLADTVGRRRMFLTASALFLLTSLAAGLAPSFLGLLMARGLQGVAAALLMPSALSIVTNTFSEAAARSRAISVFSAFAAVGSGSGLSLGGLVASSLGWQWVFFINVPVILLTLLLAYRYMPSDSPRTVPLPDIKTGLLLTVVIVALSFLVHELGHWQTERGWLLTSLATVLLGTWWFGQRNTRQEPPFIDIALLKSARAAIGAYVCLGASFTGFLFLISLLLQRDRQLSAAEAGLLLLPFSLLSAVTGKWLVPLLLKRLSVYQLALVGMLSLLASPLFLLLNTQLTAHPPALLWLAMGCANGIGITLAYSGLTVLVIQPVPEAAHGLASGVATTAYFVGGGLGLAIVSLFLGSDPVVGVWPLMILGTYALVGLAILSTQRT